MPRAKQELETDERLLALQQMKRPPYSLEYLSNFVEEWEAATDMVRTELKRRRRTKR